MHFQDIEDAIYKRRGYKSPTARATSIMMLLIVFVFVIAIMTFGYVPVSGTSMMPTIRNSGDAVVIFKYATIERGDIVIVDNQDLSLHHSDKLLIKRIIAIEGDHVSFKPDSTGKLVLKINGVIYNEPYIKKVLHVNEVDNRLNRVETGITVPKGCVYLMGDNRLTSHDSRNFGCISIDRLVGEAILILR